MPLHENLTQIWFYGDNENYSNKTRFKITNIMSALLSTPNHDRLVCSFRYSYSFVFQCPDASFRRLWTSATCGMLLRDPVAIKNDS